MTTRKIFWTVDVIDADLLRFTERATKIFEQVIRENPTLQKNNRHHTVKARRKSSEDTT